MKSQFIIAMFAALALPSFAEPGPPAQDARGFSLPQPGYEFAFPRDHGSHPDFAIEWWYITGHLDTKGENSRRFGYQLTFFRLAQAPPSSESSTDNPAFRNSQLHLAHFALSDLENETFYEEERLNREGWDATAAVGDLDLLNGNWTLKRSGADRFTLRGTVRSDVVLDLELSAQKPAVIFGEDGVSQKSADPSAASYYITYTRFAASGNLQLLGNDLEVSGSSWMDHEISSSQLGPDQTGWDWVSMQLDDGREIMAYVLRRDDGSYDPFSSLTWIDKDGSLEMTKIGDFEWIPGGDWTSPSTGATYPISPTVNATDPATGKPRTFRIRPLMQNQEINGKVSGMAYWEGACDVVDESGEVIGRAYLELAGYTGDLRKRLRGQ
jgi:predicted secreted hydrolase